MAENRHYELIFIGGGPAGCCGALYAARNGIRCAVLEALLPGGQLLSAGQIHNYPGAGAVSGQELARRFHQDAASSGAVFLEARVTGASLTGSVKRLDTTLGLFTADGVVICAGAYPRQLGLPGEQSYLGKGVSYCAHCDAPLYRGEDVALVGGGNTALSDALVLSRVCKSVTLLHRRGEFRGSPRLLAQVEALSNVTIRKNTAVTALHGEELLSSLTLSGGERIPCRGLFIAIGRTPATEFLGGQLPMDENGYLLTDEGCKTVLPGVYAAGDIRKGPLKQIVTAAADGALAACFAAAYLKNTGNA